MRYGAQPPRRVTTGKVWIHAAHDIIAEPGALPALLCMIFAMLAQAFSVS